MKKDRPRLAVQVFTALRSRALGRHCMNATILETIKRSATVPSMPQVVLRFLEIMRDPDFDYADLVKVLSADPGTVGEILRLANSALFGVRNKVVSPKQALTLLGPKRTRSLLLGRYLVDTMSRRKVAGLDMRYFWRRSLSSSIIASHFAEKLVPRQRDEAFIGALLADIGIPILAETFPKKYAAIIEKYCPGGCEFTGEEEISVVDVTHADVSAMVLGHWMLPAGVVTAVNLHQSLDPGQSEAAQIARILRAADRIGALLCEEFDAERAATTCQEALAYVRLAPDLLLSLLPTVERDIEELADALRIDVVANKVYQCLAQALRDRVQVTAAGAPA